MICATYCKLRVKSGPRLNIRQIRGQRITSQIGDKDYWQCAYDALGQLSSAAAVHNAGVQYPWEATSWTFDAAQNVETRTRGGLTYSFNTDSRNRLTNIVRSGTMTVVGYATNDPA